MEFRPNPIERHVDPDDLKRRMEGYHDEDDYLRDRIRNILNQQIIARGDGLCDCMDDEMCNRCHMYGGKQTPEGAKKAAKTKMQYKKLASGNKWLAFVKEFRKLHPNLSYKDVLVKASDVYERYKDKSAKRAKPAKRAKRAKPAKLDKKQKNKYMDMKKKVALLKRKLNNFIKKYDKVRTDRTKKKYLTLINKLKKQIAKDEEKMIRVKPLPPIPKGKGYYLY